MVNMKLSSEKAKEYSACSVEPGDGPAYPYGLVVCLDNDGLKKLGYTEPPAVGAELTLVAKVTVISSGVSQQQDGDKQARAELQITDMELSGAERAATADVLYK